MAPHAWNAEGFFNAPSLSTTTTTHIELQPAMESRKRKLPPRAAARAEAVIKKATPTPPPPREPTGPPTPVVVENPLPKSLVPGKPLPTLKDKQPDDLPDNEYQSFAESRVMAESIERSRHKWKIEGIFEKYWTKPVKRKAKDPPPAQELRNPPKESMTKIGMCIITIEPHSFEAIMYGVKDTSVKSQPAASQPAYRPIIQYGPPNGVVPQHAPSQQYNTPIKPPPMQIPSHQSSASGTPIKTQSPAGQYTPINSHQAPQLYPASAPPRQPPPPPPPQPAKSSDPVIQMLAERAATDPDLKALMRIVADGKATTDQLKMFQSHIDELQEILRRREREAAEAQQARLKAQQSTPLPPQMVVPAAVARQQPIQQQRGPSTPQYLQTAPPQPIRSKAPPAPKPDITAVVFEFVGGNGDRYKFPRFSTLEYVAGAIIASFLIVRKGSAADAGSYDPKLDYYQPVTIRICANGPGKVLESVGKVVAPLEEVRAYMDDVMDKMKRADDVHLALRLPREVPLKEDEEKKAEEAERGRIEKLLEGCLWNVSAEDVRPKKMKLGPVVESEEERYQKFIASIS